jgi:hypothetical protein
MCVGGLLALAYCSIACGEKDDVVSIIVGFHGVRWWEGVTLGETKDCVYTGGHVEDWRAWALK